MSIEFQPFGRIGVSETSENAAVAVAIASWLLTARPTLIVAANAIESVPIAIHSEPSADANALTVVPRRSSFSHIGAAAIGPVVLKLRPPWSCRRWNAIPLDGDTSRNACFDPALVVSRSISPAFDQALAFCSDATFAMNTPSPVH